MKTYNNGMKATEFSRKQIGVIFAKAKKNELKVEKWIMSMMYDMADYYNYDFNGNAAKDESKILDILNAVFSNDTDKAQELIDNYTASTYELLGIKAQKNADRNLVA